jgi:hypothetical protein
MLADPIQFCTPEQRSFALGAFPLALDQPFDAAAVIEARFDQS